MCQTLHEAESSKVQCHKSGCWQQDIALLLLLQLNGLGAVGSWWLLLLLLEVAVAALQCAAFHICKVLGGN